MKLFLIGVLGESVRIAEEGSPEATTVDGEIIVRESADLSSLDGEALLALHNKLLPAKPTKRFNTAKGGIARVWKLLEAFDPNAPVADTSSAATEEAAPPPSEEKEGEVKKSKAKKTKKAKKVAGTKRSGAGVAERVLKFAENGKTSAQLLSQLKTAFPERKEGAIKNTLGRTLSDLCKAKKMTKARVEGKGMVYTTK